MADPGIVRSRAKIQAAITSARAYLDMQEKGEDFSAFIWSFVGGAPIQNQIADRSQLATETQESRALSKALKARGFKFCGPVIVYAFMQAVGMVNDHYRDCFRWEEVRLMTEG